MKAVGAWAGKKQVLRVDVVRGVHPEPLLSSWHIKATVSIFKHKTTLIPSFSYILLKQETEILMFLKDTPCSETSFNTESHYKSCFIH